MAHGIVVELSDEDASRLREVARADGISEQELVTRAVRRHIFLRRFRQLRAQTIAEWRAQGQRDLTDDDVFELIS